MLSQGCKVGEKNYPGDAWGQTIGVDAYPVLGGAKVYAVTNCKGESVYGNTEGENLHDFENGKFVVRNVGGKPVAVAVGKDNERFNGMIKLNSSGEVIFKMLSEGDITLDALLARFAAHFGITEETARPSVMAFLDHLRKNELLEEKSV